MADIKTPEERSRNMAKIKNKDTKPEVWLRKQIFKRGCRYRKNVNTVQGHPDIWLAKYNTAVFVHGCFWHHHPGCKGAYIPKSRVEFWTAKFQRNAERDAEVAALLLEQRIKMLIVWECTVKRMMKDEDVRNTTLDIIEAFFESDELHLEI